MTDNSVLESMFSAQDDRGIERALWVTDIDQTFRLSRDLFRREARLLWETALHFDLPINANTGMDFAASGKPEERETNYLHTMEERIQAKQLPLFPAVTTSLGTHLRLLVEAGRGRWRYQPLNEFDEWVQREIAFDRNRIIQEMEVMRRGGDLDDLRQLSRQPTGVHDPLKVSYYFYHDHFLEMEMDRAVEAIQVRLGKAQREQHFSVVVSGEYHFNEAHAGERLWKYCLDITPVDKFEAVDFLRQKYAVPVIIFSGDSSNDWPLFFKEKPARWATDRTEKGLDVAIVVGGSHNVGFRDKVKRQLTRYLPGGRGKRLAPAWTKVRWTNGHQKLFYVEQGNRIGPASILRALKELGDQLEDELDSPKGKLTKAWLTTMAAHL